MKKITLLLATVFMAVGMNAQVLEESFDDITILPAMGWDMINLSNPIGATDWAQGDETSPFPPYEGTGYISANFNNAGGVGHISNWLITPVITLSDSDIISFYTAAADQSFPDRLEVRLSTEGAGSTNPVDNTDVGSYTTILLEINPDLQPGVYPETWTEFPITISGIGNFVECRLAFRYNVTDSGPSGSNGNFIGIDQLAITSTVGIEDYNINGFNFFYAAQTKDLTISANNAFSHISIYNVLGQDVISKNLSSNTEVINLASLNNGVYIAKATADGQTVTFKVVKR